MHGEREVADPRQQKPMAKCQLSKSGNDIPDRNQQALQAILQFEHNAFLVSDMSIKSPCARP